MRKEFSMMDLKEEDEKDIISDSLTPSFGGVTLGIAQILAPEQRSDVSTHRRQNDRTTKNHQGSLEKTDSESTTPHNIEDKMSTVLSYAISNDDSAVEVFMDGSSSSSGTPFLYQQEAMVPVPETSYACDELEAQSFISIMTEEDSLFHDEIQRTSKILGPIKNNQKEEIFFEKEILHSKVTQILPKTKTKADSFERNKRLQTEVKYSERRLNGRGKEGDESAFMNCNDLPHLDKSCWSELDASSFNVRGPTYLTDRKKMRSSRNILRLITVDFLQVSEPLLSGLSLHPGERVSFF